MAMNAEEGSSLCWSCNVSRRLRDTATYPESKTGSDEEMEDNGWKSRLTSLLCNAWQEQLFTDLTILSQDESFHVHKVILAVASPYFRALFRANLSEGKSNVLKLENIRGKTLKVAIEYVYSGKAFLTEENATEVLALAEYFQIYDLKRLCCNYIKKHLTSHSCLPVYELAQMHNCDDLASFAFQMALENCSEVIHEPSFLSLHPNTLSDLLQQQILSIWSEDELMKALMAWMSCDKTQRIAWYSSLLGFLNEDQFNPTTKRMFHDEVEKCQREISSRPLTSEGARRHTFVPRHRRHEELLIIFGGESSGRILGNSECFALGFTSWRCSIPNDGGGGGGGVKCVNQLEGQQVIPPMVQPRTHAAVAVMDNVIYLIGGQTSSTFLSSCETYHVDENRWDSFRELPLCLHGAQAIFFRGSLWVLGGRSIPGSVFESSILMYDKKREDWSLKSKMPEGRVHFGITAIQDCFYVIGGLSKNTNKLDFAMASCHKYDMDTDTWTPIAPLAHGRAYHGVATIDDYIYAIGGYDGNHWLSSVERYDPLKDRWTEVSPMIGTRSSFGVTTSRGRIYCIGGFSGENVLNTVEKYNPRTDMWHCVQSMRLRRYGAVAATLKLPSERLKPTETFGIRIGPSVAPASENGASCGSFK